MAVASRVPSWRKWTSITLLVLHLVLPVVARIVVLLIVAIAMLGKDGGADLMSRFGSVIKRLSKWDVGSL